MANKNDSLTPTTHSVADVAKCLGIGPDKVRTFISIGELKAMNVGLRSRPRWRILKSSLDAFISQRTSANSESKKPRQKKMPAVRNWLAD